MLRILTLIAFCLISLVITTSAQKKTTGAETKQSAPQTLKKSNRRPAVKTPKGEPFDKATVETMAAQCVRLETEAGAIELEMFPESAPESVRNFLNLAAIGAFDTTTFSRVVPRFVIQGGNLTTREKITPELAARSRRTIPDEPNQVKHERGILSMARPDEPNSASTHFFILVTAAPNLDGTFAAFGRVTKGMEVVDAINKMPVENEKPEKPVRISRATVAPCAVNK
ncbi:MAG: peptidylprolyl isomerase [Acidobacteriota bacterium]|nr:peptidylprolyl isomerase [Acidobacteriota bacterium]